MPVSYSLDDFKEIVDFAKELLKDEKVKDLINFDDDKEEIIKILAMMSMTNDGQFGPQGAYLGGIIAQEAIKAITGKFMPIVQTMYADCAEILHEELFSAKWMNEAEKTDPEQKTEVKIEEKPEEKADDKKDEKIDEKIEEKKDEKVEEKKDEKIVLTLYDANQKKFMDEVEKLGVLPDYTKHRNIGLQKLIGTDL